MYFQHIFGHHPYTNIDGFDPDISTAEKVSIRLLHNVLFCSIIEEITALQGVCVCVWGWGGWGAV